MRTSRRSAIDPFRVMEVMAAAERRASDGTRVFHLEVGQPSTPAPALVRQAAHEAIDGQRLGYSNPFGLLALRQRIRSYYQERHQLDVPIEQIAVTAGASAGFILAMLAGFDAGQRIGLAEPGYAAYRNIIPALDLELVSIPVGPSNRYVPTPGDLEQAGHLDGLVLASPANPTGTIMTAAEQASLVAACRDGQVNLVADEIYHHITYGIEAPAMLAETRDCIVVQSFSKYYSMTGWRLGWMVMPPEMVEPITRLAQNLFICPPVLSQHAAIAAFDATDELEDNVKRYARNRQIVLAGLTEAGLTDVAPADGAFYAWVNIESLDLTSTELSALWLRDISVAVTPGLDFDGTDGDRHIRISYAESTADVGEAMSRIVEWVSQRSQI